MSTTVNKILIPLGFSDQSLVALGQGMNLARINNADVVLLSVIEDKSSMYNMFFSNDKNEDIFKEKVTKKLNDLAQIYIEKYSIDIEIMVAKGIVYEKICEISELVNASIIVMGTNGSPKGITKRFIGSNAEKVVRSSKCPVITIKGDNHKDGCDNIILPLDLTKETKEKVTYAIEFARYWNATVRVVSVVLSNRNQDRNHLQSNLLQVANFIKKQA